MVLELVAINAAVLGILAALPDGRARRRQEGRRSAKETLRAVNARAERSPRHTGRRSGSSHGAGASWRLAPRDFGDFAWILVLATVALVLGGSAALGDGNRTMATVSEDAALPSGAAGPEGGACHAA